jgi:hypothetical protein
MISEAIETIRDMAPAQNGRETMITIEDPSIQHHHVYIYNDNAKAYERAESILVRPPMTGAVSNVESFLAHVREETLRRALVNATVSTSVKSETSAKSDLSPRHDGSFMTVVFSESGAKFSPDDREQVDFFSYRRALSPQWQRLIESLNKPLDHKTFIRTLQALRPSIDAYDELMRHFRKLSFSDKTSIASEPMLDAGRNANEYKVEIELRSNAATGGTTSATTLPSSFDVTLQYARGSEKAYTTIVEIDLAAVMIPNSDRKALRFTLIAPDLANVVEQAVDDEVKFFRDETADIPRLLILADY